jgi:hypothetical protein
MAMFIIMGSCVKLIYMKVNELKLKLINLISSFGFNK